MEQKQYQGACKTGISLCPHGIHKLDMYIAAGKPGYESRVEMRENMETAGLTAIKKEMDQLILHGNAYRKGVAKPPHFIIKQKKNNGQTNVTNYIADTLYKNKLRRFGGLDICLEYTLDGSLKQVKQVFSDISANAVYTNEYEGVVAMDVTKLARYLNEFQVDYFLENMERVAENATMVIYYDECGGKRMDALMERIKEALHSQTCTYIMRKARTNGGSYEK